jgi:ubiquinone/menaquinone biosynthesis C-methylase UbiE
VTEDEATALLGGEALGGRSPAIWADLGCGDGTFTRALTTLLPPESVIHAMDRDAAALANLPRMHARVSIVAHAGDFMVLPWPFNALDGVLLANSLHYVRDQAAFIRNCAPAFTPPGRFLIVEYDTEQANRWVPYPLSRTRLRQLFSAAGYSSITVLASRPSVYQRAEIYSALVE